ncbi:uncharacterized protein LOC119316026 [Triticum dicoccoides]|uniref:uncharacterized protein LOC119316026 n=1 Tax=Triticum dicoccoides TaxID=85692 RepID=UPI0018919A51|nr:uncharacterized protein LOC119316026 [Triticum dicoccoides]
MALLNMMDHGLFKLDNVLFEVDTADATDDDKPLEDEPQNEFDNDAGDDDFKHLSQNAEDHVPAFDELDEDVLTGQLFAENPQELAQYAENHVPMYDDHDYGPDRLQRIQCTLANSQRYEAHGLDMLAHAALLLTQLRTAERSDHVRVSEAHLEGITRWAEQMGAYAEVLDDYCDEVHEFALYLIRFDLEDPVFARHQELETVANRLIREQRNLRARVRRARERMQVWQAWFDERVRLLHLR